MTETVMIPVADLKRLPEHLFPRIKENEAHIESLANALKRGDTLPLLVVDAGRRVVDGCHRWMAHRRAFGEGCSVACEVRTYKSEKDLFFDAVRENARHGLRFSADDQARQEEIRHRLHDARHNENFEPQSKSAAESRAGDYARRLLRGMGDGRLRQNRVALEPGLRKLERAITAFLDRGQTADDF